MLDAAGTAGAKCAMQEGDLSRLAAAPPLPCRPPTRCTGTPMIESLLLTAARVFTFEQQRLLTNASSFFFERDERLFLVTGRHVMIDEPSKHFPDRIEIELHIDPDNMAKSTGFSIPLYRHGKSLWRQGLDTADEVDVAEVESERAGVPATQVAPACAPPPLLAYLE